MNLLVARTTSPETLQEQPELLHLRLGQLNVTQRPCHICRLTDAPGPNAGPSLRSTGWFAYSVPAESLRDVFMTSSAVWEPAWCSRDVPDGRELCDRDVQRRPGFCALLS
ncbi:hypothetical protein chiPu_0012522 [Chiloscyllium punctatum]|uniref:Uncharacterized protein n=1 Tax=Chiloscyllium punctatum TaxID=137246 RepID=A0A401SUI0_CHIPU|nr:hypothetical protein [Chiloscyllium punctatum]